MKYSNSTDFARKGLGKTQARHYSSLLRNTNGTITVSEAAKILRQTNSKTSMFLSLLVKKGWLKRIGYGVYIPIPIESSTTEYIANEPFLIVNELFSPCYIAGMNAANYWGLTDQLFRTTTVMTQKLIRDRNPIIAGNEYKIHTINSRYFYGLKSTWIDSVRIKISDPTRTLVDMGIFPQFCGGIRFIEDVLIAYWQSELKDLQLLMQYLEQSENGTAFKRIGYLTEKLFPDEKKFIQFCQNNLTQGYSKIEPSIQQTKLSTRWRLWIA